MVDISAATVDIHIICEDSHFDVVGLRERRREKGN
jgi:hypothetical protein